MPDRTHSTPEHAGEVVQFLHSTTERGFDVVQFLDCSDTVCTMQQSSLAIAGPPGSSALWLGVGASQRMHLTRDQVETLVAYLQGWLDTGRLQHPQTKGDHG